MYIYMCVTPISNDGMCAMFERFRQVLLPDLATEPRELSVLICFVLTKCRARLNATYSRPWDLPLYHFFLQFSMQYYQID